MPLLTKKKFRSTLNENQNGKRPLSSLQIITPLARAYQHLNLDFTTHQVRDTKSSAVKSTGASLEARLTTIYSISFTIFYLMVRWKSHKNKEIVIHHHPILLVRLYFGLPKHAWTKHSKVWIAFPLGTNTCILSTCKPKKTKIFPRPPSTWWSSQYWSPLPGPILLFVFTWPRRTCPLEPLALAQLFSPNHTRNNTPPINVENSIKFPSTETPHLSTIGSGGVLLIF